MDYFSREYLGDIITVKTSEAHYMIIIMIDKDLGDYNKIL